MNIKVSVRDLMATAVVIRVGRADASFGAASIRVRVLLGMLRNRGWAVQDPATGAWALTTDGDAELDKYIAAAAPRSTS